MKKLYDYWDLNRVVHPYRLKDRVGYKIINTLFGWYFSKQMAIQALTAQLAHHRSLSAEYKRKYYHLHKENLKYIATFGEVEGDTHG